VVPFLYMGYFGYGYYFKKLPEEAAADEALKISEPPAPVWNPDVLCDGQSADACAKFRMGAASLSEEEARQQVMKEFPSEFKAAPATTTPPTATTTALVAPAPTPPTTTTAIPATNAPTTTAQATAMWNPNVNCGGHSAGGRAKWLMDNRDMSEAAAREKVMKEFPAQFKAAASLVEMQASCIDPALADPESWECECVEEMTETCGGVDEECFRGLLCKNGNVCAEWKQTHCPASLIDSLVQRSNHSTSFGQSDGKNQHRRQAAGESGAISSADARELLEKRTVSINAATEVTRLSNIGGLDDTLSGKCAEQ